MNFDLVDDPWIPVVTERGRELASLRRCLVKAASIHGLAVESPLEAVAVFRQVLLPVYLDAVFAVTGSRLPRTSEEWRELWQAGTIDRWPTWASAASDASSGHAPVTAYLERFRDRFLVFGERPFAQVAGLRTGKGETKPVSVLIASAASGNNVPLFSARTEADPPALSVAEAIRAVLATHCWDTAAIKSGAEGDPQVKAGKTTGNPTGPVGGLGVVLPLGRTLAETLLLHVPMWAGFQSGDRPQWHVEQDATWKVRPPYGLLDLLTWQSRRVRLVPEPGPDGASVVRRVVLTAGDRLHEHRVPLDVEPHTASRMSKTRKVYMPVRHIPGQAAWRGMLPMLATRPNGRDESTSWVLRQVADLQVYEVIGADYPLRVLTVGVQYGNQSAVVEDVIADMIPLPVAALRAVTTDEADGGEDGDGPYQVVEEMVRQAEALRRAANDLANDLRQAAGGVRLPWDKGQNVGDRMVHDFTPAARRVLSGLQRDPQATEPARTAWVTTAARIAQDSASRVLNATSPASFLGRKVSDRQFQRASVAEAHYWKAVRDALGDILGGA